MCKGSSLHIHINGSPLTSWPPSRSAGQAGSAEPGVGRRVPLRHPRHPSPCNCYCGNELSHPSLFSSFGLAIQTFKRAVIKGGKILMHERAVRGDVRGAASIDPVVAEAGVRGAGGDGFTPFFCLSFAISH